jgi:hypothetical protein
MPRCPQCLRFVPLGYRLTLASSPRPIAHIVESHVQTSLTRQEVRCGRGCPAALAASTQPSQR